MDKFPKQPLERRDIDVVTEDWMPISDYIQSATISVTPVGLTVDTPIISPDTLWLKVWVSGGTNKVDYKITTTITTHDNRVKEHEFMVKVREL